MAAYLSGLKICGAAHRSIPIYGIQIKTLFPLAYKKCNLKAKSSLLVNDEIERNTQYTPALGMVLRFMLCSFSICF